MKKLLLLIVLLLSINACKKDDVEPVQEDQNTTVSLTEINFTIELPDGVETSSIINYKLSNAYGDYDLQISAGRGTTITNNISSTVEVLKNGSYQINYLVNPQGSPVMCSISDINTIGTYQISAHTTAIAMLMSHPLLISTNTTVNNKIEELLITMPSFSNYVAEVQSLIYTSISQQMTPDFTAPVSYKQTIIEVINSNMENFNLSSPNGMMEINLEERDNGILKYTLTNHHKRVLHIYPKKVWVDDNTGVTIQEEALVGLEIPYSDYVLPKIEILTSKGFNFWSSTWSLITGQDLSVFEHTSDVMEADISAADKLKLEVYGIGKLSTPFSQLSEEEQIKIVIVGIHGGYQDFIRPAIDLFLGLKNIESSGENDQHFDFRYGSKKAPFTQLITNLSSAFIADNYEMFKLGEKLANEDYIGIIQQFVSFSFDQIFGDAQHEDVKKRYLNNIYDLYKDIAGISATSDEFRNLVKRGANQISAVKQASFVGQVVSIAELATNVAGAIYAYYDSDYRNDFYFNKTSETIVTLQSPENNFTIPTDVTEQTFIWDFDRGNLIGTISYELIINETLENQTVNTHTFQTGTDKNHIISLSEFEDNSTSFTWKVRVFNTQGNELIESDTWDFNIQSNKPIITLTPISNITESTATSGGNVTYEGGSAVTEKGIVWSTSPNPIISDNKTIDGTGIGSFISSLTELFSNTTYYLRAYATNSMVTNYSQEIEFTTNYNNTVTDFDGNVYETVVIGNQTWLKENLKTTHFRNGDVIPTGLTGDELLNTINSAYTVFDNDLYGKLYNWYAVTDSRGICPEGYHTPSATEWDELVTFVGPNSGGNLKSTSSLWNAPNNSATNNSGFSGLPGGQYRFFPHDFHDQNTEAIFWSSTEASSAGARHYALNYSTGNVHIGSDQIKVALRSCRCVND